MEKSTPAELTRALHRFGLERDRLRAELIRRLGLAMADLDALEHLELTGPISQRELAERLVLTSGAVTQLVDRLEKLSLVTRTPHPSDRRITLVGLAAKKQLPPVPELERYHAALGAAAAALSPTARRHIAAFLAAVADSAAETAETLRTTR